MSRSAMRVAAPGHGPLLQDGEAFDIAVIGAGGAGLAAALFAALGGQKVLLLESTPLVGGTTAFSAGSVWVPGTRHAASVASAGQADTVAEAERYLDAAVGSRSDAALRQAFLAHGRETIEQLESRTEVRLRAYPRHPDYLAALPGATLAGRVLEPLPFDGRLLGDLLPLLRPPLPEFTVLGGMMVDRTDIGHLLGMRRSLRSLRHAMSIVGRHLVDRLRHPRGTRLVMGNALVGRLLASLAARPEATLALQAGVRDLLQDASGTVCGLAVEQAGRLATLHVHRGVILATGGFSRHPQMRRVLLPGIAGAWSPTAPGATGELLDIARSKGARWGAAGHSHAFWAPVSLRKRPDGSTAAFPHFVMDRAKPGVLAVDQLGERFVNESTSYHLFGLALQERQGDTPVMPAYLVCDARALRTYGLGMVRPGGMGLRSALADGYLTAGRTLHELACRLLIDPEVLGATVARFNQHADRGIDPDFARGTTAYERHLGDASAGGSNPSLGRLDEGPFYALKLYPGDIGTATGLATDVRARVLDTDGQAIAGLYAAGNDMHSVMGGVYPGPGITLGPALVFARIAAQDAAARPSHSTRS